MEKLLKLAEEEMKELRHPYVGTEHLMLAFLKKYNIIGIDYDTYKKFVIEIIGMSHSVSPYLLYTPLMRKIVNKYKDVKSAMLAVLSNDDAIAYNILLSKKIDIENLYLTVMNTL